MWNNLVGIIKFDELKSLVGKESGGCIIFYLFGIGKMCLIIVFFQLYLEQFLESYFVVIVFVSLMFIWEEEFKKWNLNILFYNMSN